MSPHTLCTYGYTGGRLEDLQAYAAAGALILDVRYSPWSRVPQWQQRALQDVLGGRYEWCRALGNTHYRGEQAAACVQQLALELDEDRKRVQPTTHVGMALV